MSHSFKMVSSVVSGHLAPWTFAPLLFGVWVGMGVGVGGWGGGTTFYLLVNCYPELQYLFIKQTNKQKVHHNLFVTLFLGSKEKCMDYIPVENLLSFFYIIFTFLVSILKPCSIYNHAIMKCDKKVCV